MVSAFSLFVAILAGRGLAAQGHPLLSDTELRADIQQMDQDRGKPATDLRRLIRVSNLLIGMGQAKALAVIGLYAQNAARPESWMFWLVRVAFTSNLPGGVFPVPGIFIDSPNDISKWPTYPVETVDAIPYTFPRGVPPGGFPESFLDYFRSNRKDWQIRKAPLVPPDDPFTSCLKLFSSRPSLSFREYGKVSKYDWSEAMGEILDLVSTAYRPSPSRKLSNGSDAEQAIYDTYHSEFLEQHCKWDQARQIYVRSDGSLLPTARP